MSKYSLQANQKYRKTKRGHAGKFLEKAKERAKAKGLPIDIDLDYVESIIIEECPIFKTKFVWGQNGNGKDHTAGPTLDRIIPELGYVKGNVAFISNLANRIKQDVTEKELYAVADWLHDKRKEVLDAFKDRPTRLPDAPHTPGKKLAEHGLVDGPRPW